MSRFDQVRIREVSFNVNRQPTLGLQKMMHDLMSIILVSSLCFV